MSNEWKPIETMPLIEGTPYLVRGEDGDCAVVEVAWTGHKDFIVSGSFWEGDGDYGDLARPRFDPIEWMPIPK